jgi:K+-sensing histidine kinase KdpD
LRRWTRWHEVQGDDPVRAIASFAQEHQITQIVIGSSQRSRWQQLTGGGSNVTRVIKEAGALGIDVHVIALRKTPVTCTDGAVTVGIANPDRSPRGCRRGYGPSRIRSRLDQALGARAGPATKV